MVPQKQIVFTEGIGDCVRTCIASLLDMSIDDVPNFMDNADDWYTPAKRWLKDRGKKFIELRYYNEIGDPLTDMVTLNRAWVGDGEYVMLLGKSPRPKKDGSTKYHAVVGQTSGWGFDIVHDPHPDNTNIVGEPYAVFWIVNE